MKVAISCGGEGTLPHEETETRPKPMVEIDGYPNFMAYHGKFQQLWAQSFILCLGYKGYVIKEYFLNLKARTKDFTIDLANPGKKSSTTMGFRTKQVDHHGRDRRQRLTEGIFRKISKFFEEKTLIVNYGDWVAGINIENHLAEGVDAPPGAEWVCA